MLIFSLVKPVFLFHLSVVLDLVVIFFQELLGNSEDLNNHFLKGVRMNFLSLLMLTVALISHIFCLKLDTSALTISKC